MPAQQTSKVAQFQPVPVQLYDYYNRLESARVFYLPPAVSTCNICERSDCGISCGHNNSESNDVVDNEEFISDSGNGSTSRKISLLFVMGWLMVCFVIMLKPSRLA